MPEHLGTYALFSTGADVVEAALRVVQATAQPGRNRIGAPRHGFHGKTMGARMLVHWDIGHQSFAGNSVLGHAPYCYRGLLGLEYPSCGVRCASLVRRHIVDKSNTSALLFEPVLGATGVLLVADEVLTGGGRTGSFLASELIGVEPDLVAMSEGMANGFPFAVLAGRHDLLHAPAAATPGAYASTCAGNLRGAGPLGRHRHRRAFPPGASGPGERPVRGPSRGPDAVEGAVRGAARPGGRLARCALLVGAAGSGERGANGAQRALSRCPGRGGGTENGTVQHVPLAQTEGALT